MINLRRWNLGFVVALLLCQATVSATPLKVWAYSVWWLPDGWRNAPLKDIDRLLFLSLKSISMVKFMSETGGLKNGLTYD